VEAAVATGYVARYLDLSTEPEPMMLLGLSRVICELKMVGMSAATLKKAVSKFAFSANPSLKAALPVTQWPEDDCVRFAASFDDADARLREETSTRMRTVPCGSAFQ
jgi:hypothetical protein